MDPTKKAFITFIQRVEKHLEEGTIHGESFEQELEKAKQAAGISSGTDDSYSDSSPGHILH